MVLLVLVLLILVLLILVLLILVLLILVLLILESGSRIVDNGVVTWIGMDIKVVWSHQSIVVDDQMRLCDKMDLCCPKVLSV